MKLFVFSERVVNRLLAVAYFSVFSFIPMITRNIIPHGVIENLYWGKELQLGYSKHPPLFAWISYLFYRLCFSWPESLYILTQLNFLREVAFLCSKNDWKIEQFRQLYCENILWESTVPVINDSFIYYAFINVKKDSDDGH
jgi:hypothetical protein